MADAALVQQAYTTILQHMIGTGRAPHYTQLAATLGLTPDEARDLATWDLTTITEYLALRLQKEGLLTAKECRAMLGSASPGH